MIDTQLDVKWTSKGVFDKMYGFYVYVQVVKPDPGRFSTLDPMT